MLGIILLNGCDSRGNQNLPSQDWQWQHRKRIKDFLKRQSQGDSVDHFFCNPAMVRYFKENISAIKRWEIVKEEKEASDEAVTVFTVWIDSASDAGSLSSKRWKIKLSINDETSCVLMAYIVD